LGGLEAKKLGRNVNRAPFDFLIDGGPPLEWYVVHFARPIDRGQRSADDGGKLLYAPKHIDELMHGVDHELPYIPFLGSLQALPVLGIENFFGAGLTRACQPILLKRGFAFEASKRR
jgi:hypothetical protein